MVCIVKAYDHLLGPSSSLPEHRNERAVLECQTGKRTEESLLVAPVALKVMGDKTLLSCGLCITESTDSGYEKVLSISREAG
jgi:hypothetical protein